MRPGPATRAALLGKMSCCPSPGTKHRRSTRPIDAPRNVDRNLHSADRHREANSANQSAALRWPTASPAVCGGLCKEAATPGQPVAPKRVLEEPSLIIHPRELPGTADSAVM